MRIVFCFPRLSKEIQSSFCNSKFPIITWAEEYLHRNSHWTNLITITGLIYLVFNLTSISIHWSLSCQSSKNFNKSITIDISLSIVPKYNTIPIKLDNNYVISSYPIQVTMSQALIVLLLLLTTLGYHLKRITRYKYWVRIAYKNNTAVMVTTISVYYIRVITKELR